VGFAAEALSSWRLSLPDGVKRSKRHTDDGRKLLHILSDASDPPRLLLDDLVAAFGGWHPEDGKGDGKYRKFGSTLKLVEKARNDIDRLIEGYVRDAVDVVGQILSLRGGGDPLAGVQAWVACFDVSAFLQREDVTMIDKAILRTARDTMNGRYSAESLARALSSVLLQRGVERWEDGTANQMRRLLRECRARIEEAVLSDPVPDQAIIPILEARMHDLDAKLCRLRASAPPLRALVGGAG
jgi:hypothetical protein